MDLLKRIYKPTGTRHDPITFPTAYVDCLGHPSPEVVRPPTALRSGLVHTPLVQDQVGLLCRADHRLARGKKPLLWRELEGLRFAAFGPQTPLRRLVESIDGLPSNVVEPAYEVADVITLESLLEAGLAVAAAFKLGTYRGRDRKLVFRPLIEPALTRTIALVTPSERALSPAAANLIDSTVRHLRRRTDAFRAAGVAFGGAV